MAKTKKYFEIFEDYITTLHNEQRLSDDMFKEMIDYFKVVNDNIKLEKIEKRKIAQKNIMRLIRPKLKITILNIITKTKHYNF